MALLNNDTVLKLIDTILDSGLDALGERQNFFLSVNRKFLSVLPRSLNPRSQLMLDIGRMNDVERLSDGQVPLLIYLQNVASFLSGLKEEEMVRTTIDAITRKTSGAKLPDIRQMPEIKETIIHTDDTVTFDFMRLGFQAAASVMKLMVPSYSGGSPRLQSSGVAMIFLGTGWLLSESLVLTNHHVINARADGEPAAAESDLHLQAKNTKALFDFDSEGLQGTATTVLELLAWHEELDYALLRIPASGRKPLRCSDRILEPDGEHVAVNIIQHPGGRSKRYGIRNNLVSASTATELRYFTDTESGSSGSPVLNDQWQVVALHCASVYVSEVSFQGKSTAYVNIGTHIRSILDDIAMRFPQASAEITAVSSLP